MAVVKKVVKIVGDGCLVFGAILTGFGVYGILGGTGIQFSMSGEVVTPQEGGKTTLLAGIILLLVGIIITILRRKMMK